MSSVIAQPEMLDAAATDLAGVGSTMAAENSAVAASTTAVAPAAADQVSTLTAAKFTAFGHLYQSIGSQAVAVLDQFVNALHNSAGSYAATEADNAAALQGATLPGQAGPAGWLSSQASAAGPDITASGSGTSTTGIAGLLNLLSNTDPTPLGTFLNSSTFNAFGAGEFWSPTFATSSVGNLSALGYIISRTMEPLTAIQAAEVSDASGLAASHPGNGVAPPSGGPAGSTGIGEPGTLAGATHPDMVDATTDAAKVRLVNAVSTTQTSPGLGAPAVAAGPAALVSSVGAGPAVLPGVSLPSATVRTKGRFARQYGFRPTATTRPPAGG